MCLPGVEGATSLNALGFGSYAAKKLLALLQQHELEKPVLLCLQCRRPVQAASCHKCGVLSSAAVTCENCEYLCA